MKRKELRGLSKKEIRKMKGLYPGKTELELYEIVKTNNESSSSKILKEDIIIMLIIGVLAFVTSIGLILSYISNSIEKWQLLLMLFFTYAVSLEIGALIFYLKYEGR